VEYSPALCAPSVGARLAVRACVADGVLRPSIAEGIEGGFTAPSQETMSEIYSHVLP